MRTRTLRCCLKSLLVVACGSAPTIAQSWVPPGTRQPTGTNDLSSIEPPTGTQHQIAASADYLLGKGYVPLPQLFNLSQVNPNFIPTVESPERDSDYIGGSASYSYGQKWYVDFSYAHGDSTATGDVILGANPIPTTFDIKDDWFQIYGRYAFPGLSGTRFSAYLRAGVTFVESEFRATGNFTLPNGASLGYTQKDDYSDILGNLGFGMSYSLFAWTRARVSLLFDGEGFFGGRDQESFETLSSARGSQAAPESTKIDNLLYGGLGRTTARFEYAFGREGTFIAFVDGGVQVKYTIVKYDSMEPSFEGKNFDELLWGPYAKIGLSWAF